MKQKAYAYIFHHNKLLVFRHTQYPEAGLQVPGGTLEEGEPPEVGVLREAREETGMENLRIAKYLGSQQIGDPGEPVLRHFFQLDVTIEPPTTWLSYEMNPSDGSPAPIEFEFFWVDLEDAELAGGQGWGLSALGEIGPLKG